MSTSLRPLSNGELYSRALQAFLETYRAFEAAGGSAANAPGQRQQIAL